MNFAKKIFSSFQIVRHQKSSNSGKLFEEIYNDFGAFTYDEESFTINYEDINKKIRWHDITKLNVYKTDLITTDRIDMEIVYGDKFMIIAEELPGWYQFCLKIEELLPFILKGWYAKVVQPPFATSFTTIYNKEINFLQSTFHIHGSFIITKRGWIVYGTIVEGVIKKENYICFDNGTESIKLKIAGIDYIDHIETNSSEIGLTFIYENEVQKTQLEKLILTEQIAIVTAE